MSATPAAPMQNMTSMYGSYAMPQYGQMQMQSMPMQVATGSARPVVMGSARPMVYGSAMPMGSAAPVATGPVHPDFPQLGAPQAYPTTVTPQDEQLLMRLQQLGYKAGQDGLPGFPYIGAPYIGVYDHSQEAGEEEQQEEYAAADDDEVRGTQV
mmetsp:Transcript_51537/g.122731  ORF Transcript_51537/g.122731 Transcript_51537/m.122731 type:complete len:154 (+) Transcript_51537:39-500(+)